MVSCFFLCNFPFFFPSSFHSTPPNTWLGNPPTGPDAPRFLPSHRGEGKGLQVRQRRGWKSLLLSMRKGGHHGVQCQVCDLPCPSLPGKSSSAIQGHLDPWGGTCPAARSMPHFLSRPGPWIGLPCSTPSHGAPLLQVMASFKSESRAAPCGPPPFLVALSSPAQSLACPTGTGL